MSSDLSQTRVKICGITTVTDAQMAAAAGADAIGLVFYPPSGRYLAVEAAQSVARAVGPLVTVVGLFVNASAEQVAEVVRQVPLAVLQFHGDESDEFCRQFDRPFMKAIRVAPGTDVAEQVRTYPSAVGILLDTYVKGVPGGTGEQFNWQQVPEQSPVPLVLAGGLRPDNVAAAVQAVKPYGVDVSGGVEFGPGQKDSTLVRDFVRAAKRF